MALTDAAKEAAALAVSALGNSISLHTADPGTTDVEITDADEGEVTHALTGELEVGSYRVELEVTRGGRETTFPNEGYATLVVKPDLR